MASFPLMVACLVVLSHLDFINCQLCPQDWTEVDGQCFQVPRDPTASDPNNRMQLGWVAARDHCRLTSGADLAQPNNLLEMAEYLRTIPGLDGYDHIWLGGSDVHIEGIWRWNNWTIIPLPIKNKEGIVTNHNGWKDGQPNSRDGLNQDCLYMMSAAQFGANVMGDEVCQGEQGEQQHFVCERTPENIGCVYGFKCYEDGAILNEACLAFKCTEGNWKYSGESIQECGNCTLWGDPHIFTYEPHNLDNTGPFPPDLYRTHARLDAEYAVSQHGKSSYDSLFGVYANFTECLAVTCVSRVHYAEPGIKVELILPKQLWEKTGQWSYCRGAPPRDPLCATKILVNKEERVIADDGSVTPFSGTDGTVLIFKDGKCTSAYCQIYVVGSKGITVSLLIEPELLEDGESYAPELYQLNVYPIRSLRGHLYGLCDTLAPTTDTITSYTPRFGPLVTDWTTLEKVRFVESWNTKMCSCAFRDDVVFGNGCVITEAAPADTACRCSIGAAIGIPECVGNVVNCKDPSLTACTDPKDGYASCLQGQGNCGGYGIIPIFPPTKPTAATTRE